MTTRVPCSPVCGRVAADMSELTCSPRLGGHVGGSGQDLNVPRNG
jgi:hypothetical protein